VAVVGVLAALALPGAAAASSNPSLRLAAGSGLSASRPQVAVAGKHYARLANLCPPPSPGRMTCFAMQRVPVALRPGQALPAGVHPDGFGAGPAGGYTPAELEQLYKYSRAGGKGQTIAIVDWLDDPKALPDLDTFDSHYGFPKETSKTFVKLNQNGKSKPLPSPSPTAAGETDTTPEITLDIESARAVCAKCTIDLVEAKSASDANLATAEDSAAKRGATEISNSFGAPENLKDKPPASFTKAFAHRGVVITASTGDQGWYGWDDVNNGSGAKGAGAAYSPATLPTVVAVGGTTLGLTSSGSRVEEVWNEDGDADSGGASGSPNGSTGGGCSQQYSAARWQHDVAGYAKTGCGTKRLAADVSALGDPYTGFDVYDSDNGEGWFTVGGTSLSAPIIAAMWALAGGAHKVPYPALTLYGNEKTHPSSLHDITLGGNAYCGNAAQTKPSELPDCAGLFSNGMGPNQQGAGYIDCSFSKTSQAEVANDHQCVAAKGYDGPSGVGTPNGLKLFAPLSPSGTIKAPRLRHHHAGKFAATTRDPFPGGAISTYLWTFGDGTKSHGAHPKHSYKKAGRYTVTLTVTDVFGLTHTTHKKVRVK
jgi:hypothetical protein